MSALRTSAGSGLHLRAAHEVVALLKAKEVTPEQLIDVAQQRIEATESAVAATPITCFERARSMARSLPKDEGQRGFLHGLPVLIKDTHPVAGVRFTEGSKLFEHRVAEQSAEVVRRLEAKGALVLGKTNVPEFCAGSQSFNSLFPTSRSPWHLASTAGGSSGGSGAALAAGQAWLATGTDLGGSLRIPAAFCGVVGFRVSPGLIGREAPGPSGPRNALHAITGPMARNVRDCGLLLDAMAGGAGWDFECPQPEEGFEAAAVRGASASAKLRVGFSTLGCRFAPAVEALCRSAADRLGPVVEIPGEELGAAEALEAFGALRAETFAATYGHLTDEEKALVKPEVLWNVAEGQKPGAAARAEAARAELQKVQAKVQEVFGRFDVLLAPTTLDAGFDASVRYPARLCGQSFENYLGWMAPACVVSAFSCPALNLPCGFLEDGRPVGVQLVAPFGGDGLLLSIGAQLEQSLGLPQGCEPRPAPGPIPTEGPRTAEEAAAHHGL